MTLFDKYKLLIESKSRVYGSEAGYSARVASKDGIHTVKFFRKGVYLKDADYKASDEKDAHNFAEEEMEHRKSQQTKNNESVCVDERILEPQGHLETADHIADDSKRNKGPVKKMMGNKTPLDIISKILAGR